MKPTKQTVYLPANGDYPKCVTDDNIPEFYDTVIEKEGYFFTTEQLNEYTQKVIKKALETAAEKVEVKIEDYGIPAWSANYNPEIILSKESITNTLEETFKKFEV